MKEDKARDKRVCSVIEPCSVGAPPPIPRCGDCRTERDSLQTDMTRPLFPVLCLLSFLVCPLLSKAEPASKVRIENVRRVFHNGEHNAFTDLIQWRGKFWLTFRSCPDGHMVFPTSSVIVLSSDDAKDWKEVHRFSVPQRDVRDPHFLLFKDRLFLYTGTWWSGDGELPREQYDLNRHLGYGVHTEDGEKWSDPTLLEGTYGHYIWRAAVHDGKAYLCGRRKRAYHEEADGDTVARGVESAMLESDDGLVWKFHSLFQSSRGDETAFLFEKSGDLLAVSRCGSQPAELLRAAPPWKEKTRVNLPGYIGGPLLAKWGDDTLVGGRQNTPDGPVTTLYWLAGDTLTEFARLPSGGDNSYPGFVELDKRHGLVSWYSSHERDDTGKPITAIYLADVVRETP